MHGPSYATPRRPKGLFMYASGDSGRPGHFWRAGRRVKRAFSQGMFSRVVVFFPSDVDGQTFCDVAMLISHKRGVQQQHKGCHTRCDSVFVGTVDVTLN